MNINKFHYNVMKEPQKIYFNMSTLSLREKLNLAFKTPTAEDDMTGIFGKYYKLDKMYKLKYIHSRNKQLQPQTYDRYYYLVDIGEDEKGSYIEYAMVYDKLYDPMIRITYILAVCFFVFYLYRQYSSGAILKFSATILSLLLVLSSLLVFKKVKESQDECEKAEKLFIKLLEEIE